MDSSTFTPEEVAALAARPRHAVCEDLLTGEVGPLSRLVAGQYDKPQAAICYLLLLAYRAGRSHGILSGRPGYEAQETFAARVRATRSRTGGLGEFAVELLRSVGSALARQRAEDLLWWREVAAVYADHWTAMRERHQLEELIAGADLANGWLWEIQKGVSNAAA